MANQLHPWPGAPAVLRIFCFGPENHILLTATKKRGLRGERGFDPPVQFGQKNSCLMNCVSTSKVSEQQKNFKICNKSTKNCNKDITSCQKAAKSCKNDKHRHVMANQLHPWPGAPAVLRIFVSVQKIIFCLRQLKTRFTGGARI